MNKNRLIVFMTVILAMMSGSLIIQAQDEACTLLDGDTLEIEGAKLYIEYQSTDGDMGVHGLFDDHGWLELCVFDPDGALVLQVSPQSQMRDLGISGIFFESNEPLLEDFSYEDLKAIFVEGEYSVVGTNIDGTGLVGAAMFTHNVPVPPVIVSPMVVDEDMADEAVVPLEGLVIEWEDVTETLAGDPVTITAYEIIITKEEHEDPNGLSRPIFDVHVPADRNRLSVPIEFLEGETLYELEILALEESGNQTISVGFFTTDDIDDDDNDEDETTVSSSEVTVTEDEAISIAEAERDSTAVVVEIEREQGQIVYSIELDDGSEVEVSADTGEILEIELSDDDDD